MHYQKGQKKNCNFLFSVVKMESWPLSELSFRRPLLFRQCWMPIGSL